MVEQLICFFFIGIYCLVHTNCPEAQNCNLALNHCVAKRCEFMGYVDRHPACPPDYICDKYLEICVIK